MSALAERDRQTQRTVGGVRLKPGHWASAPVHAFRYWIDDSILSTWCDLRVDLSEGGAHTTDLIQCVQCAEASWQAFRSTAQQADGRAAGGDEL